MRFWQCSGLLSEAVIGQNSGVDVRIGSDSDDEPQEWGGGLGHVIVRFRVG